LVLTLERGRWPTRLKFLSDAPKAALADPGPALSGTATLSATATAIKGRTVASVAFEYSEAGANAWIQLASVSAPPFSAQLDTSSLAPGRYDLRVVVTDSAGVSAVSPTLTRQVQGRA